MGSVSSSLSGAPISDIKPTLNESPAEVFNNQSKSNVGSNVSESLFGDSLNWATASKSTYGDSLTNSSQYSNTTNTSNITLGQGASITDGGAIGAMFQLTKQVLESQQKSVIDTVTEAKKDAETTTATELKDKFLEFYQNNKAAVILGAVAAGWLIYKGVK